MTVPDCAFLQHGGGIANNLGVTELLAPDPDFQGGVCTPEQLPNSLVLGSGVSLFYGAAADCCYPIQPWQAYVLRTAGCAGLRVKYPGDARAGKYARTGAGHGGLKSFFNHVCETLVETMKLTKAERAECKVSIVAAIHPRNFDHPTRHKTLGQKHQRLCHDVLWKWGRSCVKSLPTLPEEHHSGNIDIEEIAHVAFERLGIPRTQIERVACGIDEFPRHLDGSPEWYTTRNYPHYYSHGQYYGNCGKPEMTDWPQKRNLLVLSAE
jgi:hypothetical protein